MTQAFNLSQLANNLNTAGQLDATDGLVNAVPVANGGTGASTAAAARTNLNVPTRTGGDASGTWGINISGNAATASTPASGGSFITSSNIGGQSVAFATNATTAANGGVTSVNGSAGAVTVNVLGNGQTWQDVSASRVNGTTYQNTTGRSIMVSFGQNHLSDAQVSVNASTWIQVGRDASGQTYPNNFIVPNNWYYRSSVAGGSRFWWSELR